MKQSKRDLKPLIIGIIALCLVIILAFVLFKSKGKRQVEKEASPPPVAPAAEQEARAKIPANLTETALEQQKEPEAKDQCAEIRKRIEEFLSFVESLEYYKENYPGLSAREFFASLTDKLAKNLPSQKESNPGIRYYHLFRSLGIKDLKFCLYLLSQPQESLEVMLKDLYEWFFF